MTINSTFWDGAALGALLLNTGFLPPAFSWRFAFLIGASIGIVVLVMRRHMPESPRWLLIHGEEGNADKVVGQVENDVSHGLEGDDYGYIYRLRDGRGCCRLREIGR
ncbi:MAG TPA: MFS transporter [Bryobacteraceae bacterium]|nr:MFS transporter [Bryobacteraceae bacterium]